MGRLHRIIKTGARRVLAPELIEKLAGLGTGRNNATAPAARTIRAMKSTPRFAPPERPIFIVGAPRSGTSITTWALGQHPNIQPMPETAWIASMAIGAQLSYDLGSERGRFSHLSNVELPPEPFFQRVGEAVGKIVHDVFEERCTRIHGDWRKLGQIRNKPDHPMPEMLLRRHSSDPKKRWIDGTPLNSVYAWGLLQLFPGARFIHLVRQPHEVVASLESFDAVGGIPHDLDDAIQNWLDHTHYAFLAQKAFGTQRVYTARFEGISQSPKAFFGGILDFLGEPWCEDCLAPLGRKINSSNVDERRKKVRALVDGNTLFQKASRLYEEIVGWQPAGVVDQAAMDELKERFMQQCRSKRLIGS